jgi:phage tail sheath protein FI
MAFQVSPGVNVSEYDVSTVVTATSTSVGAFVGDFNWGPVNKVVTVSSEKQLASIFSAPDSNTYESFFSAASYLAYSNNLKTVRVVGAAANNATSNSSAGAVATQIQNEDQWTRDYGTGSSAVIAAGNPAFVAKYPGELGNHLQVAICSGSKGFTKDCRIVAVNGNNAVVFYGSNASPSAIQVPVSTGESNTWSDFAASDFITINKKDYTIASIAANTIILTENVNLLSDAANNVNSLATLKWRYKNTFTRAPGTSKFAKTAGVTNDEIHIAVIDRDGKITGVKGAVVEKYEGVSKLSDAMNDDGTFNYYVQNILDRSNYIYVGQHLSYVYGNISGTSGLSDWGTPSANGVNFYSTSNKLLEFYNGSNQVATTDKLTFGYDLFAGTGDIDVSLIITGPHSATIQDYCLQIAETRKDCVTFVSPPKSIVTKFNSVTIAQESIDYKNTLTNLGSYGFMDSGWKYQFDKYNNTYRWIPLNADIAGLCARTDKDRDSWWSPAGFNRGKILNAIKLAWNPSKADRDDLFQQNINPVCSFPGEGIVLYGDKTLQTQSSSFDHLNVRRLFITLEKSIANAAKYSLFEFNDTFTRSRFVSLVEPFLRDVQARRGIYEFKVICDETNNTPQVIDTNRFVGDIYIKPARSVNYIQLNFVAVATGVEFSEIVGQY